MACKVISTVDTTIIYHNTRSGTDAGDRYKFKKVLPIPDIGTNKEK